MGVYEIPPELAAKYIPPNRLGQGCGPWVQVLGQEPVMRQGAYFKSGGTLMLLALPFRFRDRTPAFTNRLISQ
jgi:hypothetical protein